MTNDEAEQMSLIRPRCSPEFRVARPAPRRRCSLDRNEDREASADVDSAAQAVQGLDPFQPSGRPLPARASSRPTGPSSGASSRRPSRRKRIRRTRRPARSPDEAREALAVSPRRRRTAPPEEHARLPGADGPVSVPSPAATRRAEDEARRGSIPEELRSTAAARGGLRRLTYEGRLRLCGRCFRSRQRVARDLEQAIAGEARSSGAELPRRQKEENDDEDDRATTQSAATSPACSRRRFPPSFVAALTEAGAKGGGAARRPGPPLRRGDRSRQGAAGALEAAKRADAERLRQALKEGRKKPTPKAEAVEAELELARRDAGILGQVVVESAASLARRVGSARRGGEQERPTEKRPLPSARQSTWLAPAARRSTGRTPSPPRAAGWRNFAPPASCGPG